MLLISVNVFSIVGGENISVVESVLDTIDFICGDLVLGLLLWVFSK